MPENELPLAELPEIVIPDNPEDFRHQELYDALLAHIRAQVGGLDPYDLPCKKCGASYVPGDIATAIQGRLFANINGGTPERLARKMMDYYWKNICAAWKEKNKNF